MVTCVPSAASVGQVFDFSPGPIVHLVGHERCLWPGACFVGITLEQKVGYIGLTSQFDLVGDARRGMCVLAADYGHQVAALDFGQTLSAPVPGSPFLVAAAGKLARRLPNL